MDCSIYSPCELTHPSLTQIDLQGLPRPLSHPRAGVERQNLKPRQSVQEKLNAEVSQPSASIDFKLLEKVATLGDPEATQTKVSNRSSCQTQAGQSWTSNCKCLHSRIREPGAATKVKVEQGGRQEGGNLVAHRVGAIS